MKAINFLHGISGAGLYFITSGQVQRAIGKHDPFEEISNPRDRVKKIDDLSKTLEREINDSFTVSIQRKLDSELDVKAEIDTKTKTTK